MVSGRYFRNGVGSNFNKVYRFTAAAFPYIPQVIHSNVNVARYLGGTYRARFWYFRVYFLR